MSADAFDNLMMIGISVLGMAILALLGISLAWVYRDAQAHGKTGCLWMLIAFFTWPLGILAYYLLRNKPVQL